ncbi:MAG: hypothetical protein ACXADA_09755 [Candidatus Hodarchaeales archaeon]|jgi:hypothetical protein
MRYWHRPVLYSFLSIVVISLVATIVIYGVSDSSVNYSAEWISNTYNSQKDLKQRDLASFYFTGEQVTQEMNPTEYFVDSNASNVDSSTGIGNHINFTTQKYQDDIYDTLLEGGGSSSSNTHSFDCAGGYMVVGDGSPDWGSPAGTISFWLKLQSIDTVFSPWSQSEYMEIHRENSMMDELELDWGSGNTLDTTNLNLQTGKWYFFAVTWDEDADMLTFYVGDENTSPVEEASLSNWTETLSEPVDDNNFMASDDGEDPVDGQGDDLRYYNTVRSLVDIQADYNKTLTGNELGLVNYYRLDNDFTDSTGTDDGSASGITSFSTDVPNMDSYPYRLDLETQWLSLPNNFTYEHLCIHVGATAVEDLLVDTWNGTGWQNIITDLTANSWNNVSITSFLNSSTFTIRYRDGNDNQDDTTSSWQIESALIRVWDDSSPPVVNDFGMEDNGKGTGRFWAVIADVSGVTSAMVRINGIDNTMTNNGTHWIYQQAVVYQDYHVYQIVNSSDTIGNYLTAPTGEKSYLFSIDTVIPTVDAWEYDPDIGTLGTFKVNVSDNWGEIDTVIINVTYMDGQERNEQWAIMQPTISGYINDTLLTKSGTIFYKVTVNDTAGNSFTTPEKQEQVPTTNNFSQNQRNLVAAAVITGGVLVGGAGGIGTIKLMSRTVSSKKEEEGGVWSPQFGWLITIVGAIIGIIAQIVYSPNLRRITSSRAEDHPMRCQIINLLEEREFENFNVMRKFLGIGVSSLTWHLQVLEDFSILRTATIGQFKVIYLAGKKPKKEEVDLYCTVRGKKAFQIVQSFTRAPIWNVSDLSQLLNLSQAMIKYHCFKLVSLDILEFMEKRKVFRLVKGKKELLTWLIERSADQQLSSYETAATSSKPPLSTSE